MHKVLIPDPDSSTATNISMDFPFKPQRVMVITGDGEEEDFTYNLVCSYNGKIFNILLSHESPPGSDSTNPILRRLLQKLEAACFCDSADPEEIRKMIAEGAKADKEVEPILIEASRGKMQSLAPSNQEAGSSLHDHMYPPIIILQVVTLNGALSAVEIDGCSPLDFHPPTTDNELYHGAEVPYYQTKDIQVLEKLYPSVYKVKLNDGVYCAKLTSSSRDDSFFHEVTRLSKIKSAMFDSSVKTPMLRGFITSHTGLVGFLMDYIPRRGQNLEDLLLGPPREHANWDPSIYDITQMQKNKWASTIEHTLKALHSQGILWIDVKTTNVLIDETTDEAWIVDFGGGNTYGWVDTDLSGTLEGDLQGLEKIKTRLGAQ